MRQGLTNLARLYFDIAADVGMDAAGVSRGRNLLAVRSREAQGSGAIALFMRASEALSRDDVPGQSGRNGFISTRKLPTTL